jgi:CO/xanthine dehydrogenase FAD-binding subunit
MQIIAGGTDLYPALGDRPVPENLLDLTGIHGFRDISETQNCWRIGAAVTWADVTKAGLPSGFDGLIEAALAVGSVQIQNRATIAGNLCNASPAADGVPPLLAMNARVELVSPRGARVLLLSDFINGVRDTALDSDELLSAILIPKDAGTAKSAFIKLGSRRYLVISIVMVGVSLHRENGVIARARVAVGACSAVAQRIPEIEAGLIGRRSLSDWHISASDLSDLTPISDVRGSSDYRIQAASDSIERAVRSADG